MPIPNQQSGVRAEGQVVPQPLSDARSSSLFSVVPRLTITGNASDTERWCVPEKLTRMLSSSATANWSEQSKIELTRGIESCCFRLDSSHLAVCQSADDSTASEKPEGKQDKERSKVKPPSPVSTDIVSHHTW